jgi:hypothetical protein
VQHFLYVIGAAIGGPVKIGISGNPDRRLGQLQTGHADRLQLFHREPVIREKARLLERLLHRDIGYMRAIGEWFNMTVEQAIAHVQFTLIEYDGIEDLAIKVRRRRI